LANSITIAGINTSYGHVRVLDRYVPDEEVGDLVAAADCVVLPYRSATQSGVVLVAYAGGCPVISTAVGGLPEVIQDRKSGILVPAGDVNGFMRAAAELITNDSLRAALGEGARARAKEFDAKTMIQRTAEVYDRVLAG
jgi:glycosyltransferase involved in cell wall biosynthesis